MVWPSRPWPGPPGRRAARLRPARPRRGPPWPWRGSRFQHRGLRLALARLGQLVGLGLAHLELRLRGDDLRLRLGLAGDGLGIRRRPPRCASLCSASLTCVSRSNAAVCSPTFCSLSSSAMRTACARCAPSPGALLQQRHLLLTDCSLDRSASARLLALGFLDADLALLVALATCTYSRAPPRPRGSRPASPARPRRRGPAAPPAAAALRPMASM